MAMCYHRLIAGLAESTAPVQSQNPNSRLCLSLIRRNHPNRLLLPPIGLRFSRNGSSNLCAVEAGRRWRWRSDGGDRAAVIKKREVLCKYAVGDEGIESRGGDVAGIRTVDVVVAAAITAALGVGNRVLHKLALVPLQNYPFFLAQLSTFGYLAVYFSVLHLRHRAGTVTDEMLSVPKAPFAAVGLLEALAAATGMAAAANLSGASIPVLSQTFLVWQILFSIIFLGRRYRLNQLVGCSLVAVGVIMSVASGSGASHSLNEAGIFWSLLMIGSFMFQAGDTVLKEIIFLDNARRLKGRSLDLFVVNSYGSAFQAIFVFLLLPFLSKLWGIPFVQLPNYLRDGAACFLNISTLTTGCEGAPLLPLLFVLVNMAYNISLLHLIKISSAVVSCLASTVSVPIAVYVFTLPLPYLGVASSLPTGFVVGAVILVMGMLLYAWTPSNRPDTATSSSPAG